MSSPYSPKYRNGRIGWPEIKLVHVAIGQLGMSDPEYRRLLTEVAGVTTSKNLTHDQRDELVRRFQSLGFVMTTNLHKQKTWKAKPAASICKDDLLRKIAAILGDIGLEWNYANGIARRMWKVDSCSWCLPEQLHSIVAALEYKRNKVMGLKPEQSLKRELKTG